MLYTSDRRDEIVSGAYEASIPTHGGSIAIAAAAATAAAVSSAIDGAGPRDILAHAEAAAADAERRWPGRTRAGFASLVRRAHDELSGLTGSFMNLKNPFR
ncbi:MAG TPA: ADP-ribosylglycohydrolase family protein [Vicinamibacterales bacterium]|jgi:ADP-ribosylglycohydrolase|nr:ADP-ribosylglycohydrolase family protein [Vicinamibacterales bacterium]